MSTTTGRPRPFLNGVFRTACNYCVRSKRGCSGGSPCEQCEKRGKACVYAQRRMSGPRGRPSGRSSRLRSRAKARRESRAAAAAAAVGGGRTSGGEWNGTGREGEGRPGGAAGPHADEHGRGQLLVRQRRQASIHDIFHNHNRDNFDDALPLPRLPVLSPAGTHPPLASAASDALSSSYYSSDDGSEYAHSDPGNVAAEAERREERGQDGRRMSLGHGAPYESSVTGVMGRGQHRRHQSLSSGAPMYGCGSRSSDGNDWTGGARSLYESLPRSAAASSAAVSTADATVSTTNCRTADSVATSSPGFSFEPNVAGFPAATAVDMLPFSPSAQISSANGVVDGARPRRGGRGGLLCESASLNTVLANTLEDDDDDSDDDDDGSDAHEKLNDWEQHLQREQEQLHQEKPQQEQRLHQQRPPHQHQRHGIQRSHPTQWQSTDGQQGHHQRQHLLPLEQGRPAQRDQSHLLQAAQPAPVPTSSASCGTLTLPVPSWHPHHQATRDGDTQRHARQQQRHHLSLPSVPSLAPNNHVDGDTTTATTAAAAASKRARISPSSSSSPPDLHYFGFGGGHVQPAGVVPNDSVPQANACGRASSRTPSFPTTPVAFPSGSAHVDAQKASNQGKTSRPPPHSKQQQLYEEERKWRLSSMMQFSQCSSGYGKSSPETPPAGSKGNDGFAGGSGSGSGVDSVSPLTIGRGRISFSSDGAVVPTSIPADSFGGDPRMDDRPMSLSAPIDRFVSDFPVLASSVSESSYSELSTSGSSHSTRTSSSCCSSSQASVSATLASSGLDMSIGSIGASAAPSPWSPPVLLPMLSEEVEELREQEHQEGEGAQSDDDLAHELIKLDCANMANMRTPLTREGSLRRAMEVVGGGAFGAASGSGSSGGGARGAGRQGEDGTGCTSEQGAFASIWE